MYRIGERPWRQGSTEGDVVVGDRDVGQADDVRVASVCVLGNLEDEVRLLLVGDAVFGQAEFLEIDLAWSDFDVIPYCYEAGVPIANLVSIVVCVRWDRPVLMPVLKEGEDSIPGGNRERRRVPMLRQQRGVNDESQWAGCSERNVQRVIGVFVENLRSNFVLDLGGVDLTCDAGADLAVAPVDDADVNVGRSRSRECWCSAALRAL